MKKLLAVLVFTLAAVAFTPESAIAQTATCTNNYTKCMNDSWMTDGWLQMMADVECFADYVACVRRKILTV